MANDGYIGAPEDQRGYWDDKQPPEELDDGSTDCPHRIPATEVCIKCTRHRVTLEQFFRFWIESDPLESNGTFVVRATEQDGKLLLTIVPQLAINANDANSWARTFEVSGNVLQETT